MIEQILAMSEEYKDYLRDESRTVGNAESISFPKTERDILHILNALRQAAIPVTVQGARTGLAAAASPLRGHIMNLSRMNRILGCRQDEAGHFFLRLEPGVVLSELRKAIAERKADTSLFDADSLQAWNQLCKAPEQFFTPDPTEASATIGGMVTCNASGARSYLYGATRGHISGLRVVLMDGRILCLKRGENFAQGNRLVLRAEDGSSIALSLPAYFMPPTKNTSGYYIAENMDAIDLFIGSDGTLGVISEVEISLICHPEVIEGAVCFFDTEEEAVEFVYGVRGQVSNVASMEFFDGDALDVLRTQRASHTAFAQLPMIPEQARSAIYVELHCANETEAMTRLFEIGEKLEQCGGSEANTLVARNTQDLDKLLFFRHAVPESVNRLIDERKKKDPAITKLGSDMAVPDEHLAHIMKLYHHDIEAEGLQSAIWGHIGNNHVHVNILPNSMEEYARGKELFKRWASEVTRLGGAVSAEHGVGKLKRDFLVIMYGEDTIKEMARVKKVFDPDFLLGQGTIMPETLGGKNA